MDGQTLALMGLFVSTMAAQYGALRYHISGIEKRVNGSVKTQNGQIEELTEHWVKLRMACPLCPKIEER